MVVCLLENQRHPLNGFKPSLKFPFLPLTPLLPTHAILLPKENNYMLDVQKELVRNGVTGIPIMLKVVLRKRACNMSETSVRSITGPRRERERAREMARWIERERW